MSLPNYKVICMNIVSVMQPRFSAKGFRPVAVGDEFGLKRDRFPGDAYTKLRITATPEMISEGDYAFNLMNDNGDKVGWGFIKPHMLKSMIDKRRRKLTVTELTENNQIKKV